jgi:hypothetical protein
VTVAAVIVRRASALRVVRPSKKHFWLRSPSGRLKYGMPVLGSPMVGECESIAMTLFCGKTHAAIEDASS